ncbi:MAG: DinB family protein [Bacteroidetes bacterium]|nr:MAG: DinB family protein [Bacteroidota bacterium]
MTTHQEMMIDQGLQAWQTQFKRFDDLINSLSDEQLMNQVAPNRNTGWYLLGHMVAIHDKLSAMLGIGEVLHPELYEVYVQNPESANLPKTSIAKLRQCWKEVHENLHKRFSEMEAGDWFKKHTAISDEDFAKEPHRNRFNVLLNRTNHFAYHLGQIAFLKPQNKV